MKAIHIARYGRFPVLKHLPIPSLGNGDLLIKMKYAPVNPSDIYFYQGKYGVIKQNFPIVGFEGSGIVIDSHQKEFVGKKVTVAANINNGTHATHVVSSFDDVFFWPDESDLKLISMGFVNPFSCVGMCSIVERELPQNVVISASASQIGRMIVSYLRRNQPNVKIVGVNRSENKKELLNDLGLTKFVLINEEMTRNLSELKGKTIFFDCLSGAIAEKIFNCLGPNSHMVCYGRQSGEDLSGIDVGQLYYYNKSISGFWLNNWIKEISKEEKKKVSEQIINNFEIYKSTVRQVFKIDEFMDAYRFSIKDKSEGKVLLDLE